MCAADSECSLASNSLARQPLSRTLMNFGFSCVASEPASQLLQPVPVLYAHRFWTTLVARELCVTALEL